MDMVQRSEDDEALERLELSQLLDAQYVPDPTRRAIAFEVWNKQNETTMLFIVAAIMHRTIDGLVEDITQDAIVNAYYAVSNGQYKYTGVPFIEYVKQIAKNLVADLYRPKNSHISFEDLVQGYEGIADPDAVLLEDGLNETQMLEAVRRLIGTLSPHQQRIVQLHYFDNCDYHDIAETLGTSYDAVRQEASRAIRKIRDGVHKSGF